MDHKQFFNLIADRSPAELETIQQAYWIAKAAQRFSFRDSGERTFEHPRAVALSLISHGYRGTKDIVLALLHDVVEDTNARISIIVSVFGPEMWRLVETISRSLPFIDPITGWIPGRYEKSPKEYFAGIAIAPLEVIRTKAADRLHNLKTCGVWELSRQERYAKETEQDILPIVRTLGDSYAAEIEAEVARIRVAIAAAKAV